jgi:FixJ family two-component response regulator
MIAIVDDEESVRKALSRLIRAAGYAVEAFSSGTDFLQSMADRPPQCVVLDLRMPHFSGLQVQQALAKSAASLPVVVVTGDDSPDSRTRALAQGARAYLRKPVDDAMLLDALQSALVPQPGAPH